MANKRSKELILIEETLLPQIVVEASLGEYETRFVEALSEGKLVKGRFDLADAYMIAVDPSPRKGVKPMLGNGEARTKGLALWSRPDVQRAFNEMVKLKTLAAMIRIASGKEMVTVARKRSKGDDSEGVGLTIEVSVDIKDRIAAAREVQNMIGLQRSKDSGKGADDVAKAASNLSDIMKRAIENPHADASPAEDVMEGEIVDSGEVTG